MKLFRRLKDRCQVRKPIQKLEEVDYQEKTNEAIKWLGAKWLLAKPIKRKVT